MRVFIYLLLCLLLLLIRNIKKKRKDEEREVPDPRESIEDTHTINFHQVSSKSDFREPSFEQKIY